VSDTHLNSFRCRETEVTHKGKFRGQNAIYSYPRDIPGTRHGRGGKPAAPVTLIAIVPIRIKGVINIKERAGKVIDMKWSQALSAKKASF